MADSADGDDPAARAPEHEDTFSLALRQLARDLQVQSATLHALYGNYDVLLRFWGTNSARTRLLRGLNRASSRPTRLIIDSIMEFTATSVTYGSQVTVAPSPAAIEENRELIASSCRDERRHPGRQIPSDIADWLIESNLAHVTEPAHGVKFYMFLKSQTPRREDDLVRDQMLRQAVELDLKSLSFYAGAGFCDYILKAVSPDFDSMLDRVNVLRRKAKALSLSPWTLPVADYSTATATETIDAVSSDLHQTLESAIQTFSRGSDAIQSQLLTEVGSLSQDERDALRSLIDRIRNTKADPESHRRLEDAIRATILRERSDFNRAASFLTSIEGDLRYFVPRFLAKHLGNDWMVKLQHMDYPPELPERSSAQDPGWVKPGKVADSWSLTGLLLALARAYEAGGDSLAASIRALFPEGWRSKITDIVAIRDDFAHGKMMDYVESKDFGGRLGKKLETMLLASMMQVRLEKAVREIKETILIGERDA